MTDKAPTLPEAPPHLLDELTGGDYEYVDALLAYATSERERAEKAEAVIAKIDHEVRDNFLSVDYDSTSAYDDWKEAHRICDDIANIIDAAIEQGAQRG